jgi:hypothetical protein
MTRRGAVLSCLLAPFASQQYPNISLSTLSTREILTLWYPKSPNDRMIQITWSNGDSLTLTEAQVRVALEADHDTD